ncbi:MAG: MBL fold metallo-hydrolase [Opitutales bacterium]
MTSYTRFMNRRQSLKTLAASLAGAGLLGTGARLSAAEPSAPSPAPDPLPQGAGYYRFTVGKRAVYVISDGTIQLGSPHPTIGGSVATAEEVRAALRDHFLPTESLSTTLNTTLIETGDARILVDAGTGGAMGGDNGHVIQNLKHAGFRPEDITHVVISHAHPDHLWGVVDGAGRNRFPNATFVLSGPEANFWTRTEAEIEAMREDPDMAGMADMFARTAGILRNLKDVTQTVAMDATLKPGVTLVPLPGHTPGHVGVRIESDGESILQLSDTANHSALYLENPDWHFGFDVNPMQAAETRKEILRKVAADRARVMAYHWSFPSLGHVKQTGEAVFRYDPEPWSW